ncbi:Hypothetical Protein FCC1311_071272 [Hondaea fermentalgiana]|uniref:Uncharacterized protein n=1 Tax=Hondaea fermentalgiana TaxID=2315210 RepID=A0A2R5GJ43_9STRA|nr:Hypothetical Protein FCC1311_071272 [Hondaea fermentalgiana]|eukprot:GBG30906.1 Hypothetical Protein FCC1311_071272 [Hondaea fermentalgiana]
MGNAMRSLASLPMRRSELETLRREVREAEQVVSRMEKKMRQTEQLNEQRLRSAVKQHANTIMDAQRAVDAKVEEILARRRAAEAQGKQASPPSASSASASTSVSAAETLPCPVLPYPAADDLAT